VEIDGKVIVNGFSKDVNVTCVRLEKTRESTERFGQYSWWPDRSLNWIPSTYEVRFLQLY
jgi:hypothetical protein